jgi:serine phosphatase RsbU (regulator of sigma subunit)
MADLKLSKKSHPSGSLSRRIVWVAILLLVIPLFLQSLFLYNQEYHQKLEDIQGDLDLLAKERIHFIEQVVMLDWAILDSIDTLTDVKRFYIQKIPFPPGAPDHFLLVSKRHEALLVGKKESFSALVMPISFSSIGRDLPSGYPIHLSLRDPKGKTIWENRKISPTADLIQVEEKLPGTDATLVLQIEKDRFAALHFQSYLFRFGALLFFVGVIGGGAVYLFTRRISRPLKQLSKTMERVSEGGAHVRYKPDWMGFEINALGLQFNETLDGLLLHAQEAERERLYREKLAEELRIGHEIQSNLLPSHVPGFPGLDIGTAYYASKEVNGDFYDLFRLENGTLLIAVCDTAGKGISACLFSLGLRSMIRSFAQTTTSLSDLVRRVNDLYLIDAHDSSMFSTLWIGIYDPAAHHLSYCTQGHPPALLRRDQALQELWTEGIALGAQKLDVISTKEITLQSGDLLLLYTDGIIEAHDPDQQLFGKKRLYEFTLHRKRQGSQQFADQLIEEVQLFSQGTPQHDDMTLVVLRID